MKMLILGASIIALTSLNTAIANNQVQQLGVSQANVRLVDSTPTQDELATSANQNNAAAAINSTQANVNKTQADTNTTHEAKNKADEAKNKADKKKNMEDETENDKNAD